MRIVFVTSRFPYPVEKGDKLRAFHQIRELSLRHEVHLVAISHQCIATAQIEAMQPFCRTVTVFRIHPLLFPLQLIIGWLQGLPLQVAWFFDRTIKRKVQYHIIHLDPDHVICQLIRATPYVRTLPFAKTLDYMDVFSEGMRQMAEKFGWLGFPFRWEAERLATYERAVYKDFDKHTIISLQDRNRLKLPGTHEIAIIPNGVDVEYYTNSAKTPPEYDIVFVGNLGYRPNVDAARILVHDILPALQLNRKSVRLLLAGARPSAQVRAMGDREGVTVQGWLPDIRMAYAGGRIFAAPMYTGLGLQNKILEAMAMGLPCITTSMVNNAIGAEPGREILIADSTPAFIEAMDMLLENQPLRQTLSDAGKQFVFAHYNWTRQVEKLETTIQSENKYSR